MTWIVVPAIIIVAAVLLTALSGKNAGAGKVDTPYVAAPTLFTAAERSFLGALDQAVGAEYRVFGKVRVADLALVRSGLGTSARNAALNRITAKHVDFVVCRASDLAVVCAVELNDSSHANRRAQERDDVKATVCRVIGLPLLAVPAQRAYEIQALREQFRAAIVVADSLPAMKAVRSGGVD